MRYIYGQGVIVPFAQKYRQLIMMAVAAILILSQLTFLLGQVGAVDEPEQEPAQHLGRIEGLIYHDVNNNSTQQPAIEPPLEGWTAWLLTHNSPFTLADEFVTGPDGTFLFDNLSFGTYYVCQDLQNGWLQTERAAGGVGVGAGGALVVGDVIGDSPELDALVAEFCYEVVLTPDNPISETSVFGNFQEQDFKEVLGDSTENGSNRQPSGNVLGTSTGQVLADTGQTAYWPILLGVFLLLISFVTFRLVSSKRQ